jgi:hypothetical protein
MPSSRRDIYKDISKPGIYSIPLCHNEEVILICRDVDDRRTILDKLSAWSNVHETNGENQGRRGDENQGSLGDESNARRPSFRAVESEAVDKEIRLSTGRYVGHILLDEHRSLSLSPADLDPNLAFMMALYCASRRFTVAEGQSTPADTVDCDVLFQCFAQQYVHEVADLFESSFNPLLLQVEVEQLETVHLQRRDGIEWDKQFVAAVVRGKPRCGLAHPPFCVRRVTEDSDFLENRFIKTALCAIISRGPDVMGYRAFDKAEALLRLSAFDDVSELNAGELEDSQVNGLFWDERNVHLRTSVMLACVLLRAQLPDISETSAFAGTVSAMRPQFLVFFPWCAACSSSTCAQR